mmetsp:Transcript_17805/g.32423  ORF Transcript_17805/g.32423 Transcript_17805/m.32423 type:complete len:342 (-) Transcript_17805:254-1279(-)
MSPHGARSPLPLVIAVVLLAPSPLCCCSSAIETPPARFRSASSLLFFGKLCLDLLRDLLGGRLVVLFLVTLLLVRDRRVDHGAHRLVVHVQTEVDAFVERTLRVIGSVHVRELLRGHPAILVVDHGVDHAVADRLGADELSRLRRVEVQFGADVFHRHTRVRDRDAAEARLNHVVRKADHQRVGLVRLKGGGVLGHSVIESQQVASPHGLGKDKVRREGGAIFLLVESAALRHLSHEQLHDHHELLHRTTEAARRVLRGLAQRLEQLSVSIAILELKSGDPARVIQVATELVVRRFLREVGLGNELIRLLHQILREEVAQEQVQERSLAHLIMVKARSAMS